MTVRLMGLVLLVPTVLAVQTNYYYVVPVNGSAQFPYQSWSAAATNIQAAADKAQADLVPGSTECVVLVSNGTYTLTSQLVLTNGITLRSFSGNPTNTLLKGGYPASTNRCLYIIGNALVDGFTITNGFADPGQIGSNAGGGVFMTAGRVQNCTLIGNSTTGATAWGAGVYLSGGVVSNCWITQNSQKGAVACVGAGAYVGGGLLTDCLITTNFATYASGAVGGVYVIGATARRCNITGRNIGRNALSAGSGALITECSISSNFCGTSPTVQSQAGVFLSGTAVVSNSVIFGMTNSATASAVQFNSGGTVVGSTIRGCASTHGVINMNNGLLRNCLVTGNSVVSNTVHNADHGVIENCTIVQNQATVAAGGYFVLADADGTIRNSIIYSNDAPSYPDCWIPNPTGDVIVYTCTSTNLAGAGNITADPKFTAPGSGYGINATPGVFTLQTNSPCIDAGTNLAWMTAGTFLDLAGNSRIRPSWGTADMGAYEAYSSAGALTNVFVASPTAGTAPLVVTFAGETGGGSTNGLLWQWIFGDGATNNWSDRAVVTHAYALRTNAYTVTLNVSNAAGETATRTLVDGIRVYPPIAYVSTNGAHVPPFETWDKAATNIQAAVDAAGAGFTTVLVSNGIYTVTGEIAIAKGITLRGFSGNWADTVIRGGYPASSNRILALSGAGAVVDGFTITNGYILAASGGGILMTNDSLVRNCLIIGNITVSTSAGRGGGIFASDGSIVNCVVQNNTSLASGGGGGIYMLYVAGGSVVVSNCLVTGNRAAHASGGGGGINATGGLVVNCVILNNLAGASGGGVSKGSSGAATCRNCLIVGNQAADFGGGVGMVGSVGVALENCTIVGNLATNGGGVYTANAIPILNCIVTANKATSAGGTNNLAVDAMNVSYSCSPDLVGGVRSNVTADPLFARAGIGFGTNCAAGNYRLTAGSPCVDKGTNIAWMSASVDLEGAPRIQGAGPNMGAYETLVTTVSRGAVISIR